LALTWFAHAKSCVIALPDRDSVRGEREISMKLRTLLGAPLLAAFVSTAAFADASSGRKAQEKGEAQIPVCTKRLGTIAVVEPDNNWWQSLGLGSPEA